MRKIILAAAAVLHLSAIGEAAAQQVVNLWPGAPPGTEHWTHRERVIEGTPVGTVVFDVSTPTLTILLPEPGKATGAAVIIASGGAFVAQAISLEGFSVAERLRERGIAAFVLKYRTIEKNFEGVPPMNMDSVGQYGIADGIQALRVVRSRAAEWGVRPDRVGMIGFSAGAMVTSAALLQADSAARPSFAAMMYGAPFGVMPAIPSRLPPMFMAWAQDDAVALAPILRFHDALRAAGHRPEVHIFSGGGHGFGMKRQGTSSDYWPDAFFHWLEAGGFIPAPQPAGT
ncbi:MAG TPA: alpha/beta hydrolase [Longimicrobium sp.]|jgi:acetyl esterase/lipase|uniref:alpha/beta hydrolase n=1 Tax=Longimicrobium sp. TaxID=2029185 RepID=UPI002EDB5859